MRQLVALGDCERCKKRGPVWVAHVKVLDFGTGLVMEPQPKQPTLCDNCEAERVAHD